MRRGSEQAQPRRRQPQRAAEGLGRLSQGDCRVVPGHQVRQHELADASPCGVLGRLPRRQMQVRWQVGAVDEGRLAQQHVGTGGEADELIGRTSVGGVGQRLACVLDPEAEGLDRVAHPAGRQAQRAYLDRTRRQRGEVEGVAHAQVVAAERPGEPLLRARRAVYRDARSRPGRMVILEDGVPDHVDAVVGMQMAEADRIDIGEPGVLLEGPDGAVTEIEHHPEIAGINQVTGCRALRAREAARPADDRYLHGRTCRARVIILPIPAQDSLADQSARQQKRTGQADAATIIPKTA